MDPPRSEARPEMARLRADPLVAPWHRKLALRARITADVNSRQLGAFLRETGLRTPAAVLKLAQEHPAKLGAVLVEYAETLTTTPRVSPDGRKGKPRLASYVAKTFTSIASFLRHHKVAFDDFPPLRVRAAASLTREEVPTPAQLRQIQSLLTPRGRVIALLMAQSGVRPGFLGSYAGDRGMTLSAMPELDLEALTFKRVPFLVRVADDLSKNGKTYVTFGTQEGADALLAYLNERRKAGEKLTPASPLIVVAPRGAALRESFGKPTPYLRTNAVTREIHEVMQKVVPDGVTWRPYVLRAYFSTRMLMAGSEGLIQKDTREFLMGHDLGVSGRYNLSKRLPETVVEMARTEYDRASKKHLLLTTAPQDSQEAVTKALRLLLAARGVPAEKLDKLDLANKSDEEIISLLKTVGAALRPEKRTEKAVPVDDVPKLLEMGWEFVSPLNGNMAILRAPASESPGVSHLPA